MVKIMPSLRHPNCCKVIGAKLIKKIHCTIRITSHNTWIPIVLSIYIFRSICSSTFYCAGYPGETDYVDGGGRIDPNVIKTLNFVHIFHNIGIIRRSFGR